MLPPHHHQTHLDYHLDCHLDYHLDYHLEYRLRHLRSMPFVVDHVAFVHWLVWVWWPFVGRALIL